METLLEFTIHDLEYKLGLWEGEYIVHGPRGDRRSLIRKSDLTFLRSKINKLKALNLKVKTEREKVVAEIKEYESKW